MTVANPAMPDIGELKRRFWLPAGAIDESIDGRLGATDATLTSGVLRLQGNLVVPAGVPVTSIGHRTGSTAAGAPTAQWFALIRQSDLAVLGKTNDDTTTPWAATTVKTLALTAPWTPTVDTPVYSAVVVIASAMPSLRGITVDASSIGPTITGNSTSGLTNPASLGATAAAPTPSTIATYSFIA
jgi:hypothetical protein